MQDIMERFSTAAQDDFKEYRDIVNYCDGRVSAEEGIPAIIGLDDLTGKGHAIFQGAEMDEKLSLALAEDALIFNWIYAQQTDRDMHYPSIAPAMSALAEKMFYIPEGEDQPGKYREMLEKEEKSSR